MTLSEMNTVMKSMAFEMEKSGLIEEYIDNAIGINEEDISDEVNEEVDKICDEMALLFKSKSPTVPSNKIVINNQREYDEFIENEIKNDQKDHNLTEKISNINVK